MRFVTKLLPGVPVEYNPRMSADSSRPKKAVSTALKVVVSAALLATMVWWVGPRELAAALRGLDIGLATASFFLQFAGIAMGGVNVILLTHAAEPSLPKRPVFVSYLRSWVIGAVAPGRLGDLTLAYFLAPLGVSYGLGLAVVMVDKLITFLVTVGIGAIGILLYVGGEQALLAAALALGMVGVLAYAIANRRVRGYVRDRLLGKHGSKFAGFSRFAGTILTGSPGVLVVNTVVTVGRAFLMGISVWVMLLAFGTRVDLLAVVFVQTIAQLAAWVPVSMAGIGVRESTATVLYTQLLGLQAAPVLNANLLTLVLGYLKAAVLWIGVGFGGKATSVPQTDAVRRGDRPSP